MFRDILQKSKKKISTAEIPPTTTEETILLQEILALGGNKSDLALLQDVDNDTIAPAAALDKKSKQKLKKQQDSNVSPEVRSLSRVSRVDDRLG